MSERVTDPSEWTGTDCTEQAAGAFQPVIDLARGAGDEGDADPDVIRMEGLLLQGAFGQALAMVQGRGQAALPALLVPVIRRLEARWQADAVGFADLAFAFFQLRRLIERAAEPPATAQAHGRILLALTHGEQHGFGAQMVAAELALHGWAVELDLSGDGDALRARVAGRHFDALGLSVGHDQALIGLADLIADLRQGSSNPRLHVILGGAALAEPLGQYDFLGADTVMPTPQAMTRWLSAHLAASRPLIRN